MPLKSILKVSTRKRKVHSKYLRQCIYVRQTTAHLFIQYFAFVGEKFSFLSHQELTEYIQKIESDYNFYFK